MQLTHSEACAALVDASESYMAGILTRSEWSGRVDEILRERFPSETALRTAPDGALTTPGLPSRKSNAADTLRRAYARSQELADSRAGEAA